MVGGFISQCDAVYADIKSNAEGEWSDTRPIVFPLVTFSSQYILSVGVVFGRPCFLGTAMALRSCIATHGFLTERVAFDGGSEFKNRSRTAFIKHVNYEWTKPPTADSRSNGQVENINGNLNKYPQPLPGGTYFDQARRSADASRKGAARAIFSQQQLVEEILKWKDLWNNLRHGANDLTPTEQFKAEIAAFPSSVVPCTLDSSTRYLTSWPLKVDAYCYKRGMEYGGKRYASDIASELVHRGHRLRDPRIDAFDPSAIWVSTKKGLIKLTSNEHHRMQGLTFSSIVVEHAKLRSYHKNSKRNQAANALSYISQQEVAVDAATTSTEATVTPKEAPASSIPRTQASPDRAKLLAQILNTPRSPLKRLDQGEEI